MPKVTRSRKTQQKRASQGAMADQRMAWIHQALEDAKARDIAVLDVRKISDFTDYMVIATGTSNRHVQSTADRIVDALRGHGVRAVGVEGGKIGDWVLIDFGDVVVHAMREEIRDFYNLEKLWSDARRVETGQKKKTAKAPRKMKVKSGSG